MNETDLKLLVVLFSNEGDAEDAINVVKSVYKEADGGLQAAVVIIKDNQSGVHYKDVGITPAKNALGGMVLGAVLGVMSGGVGIALGAAGALVGGLLGEKRRAEQFSSVRMNEAVAALVPGSSAIVALVEQDYVKEVEKQLGDYEIEIFTTQVSSDLGEQLEPHRRAIYDHWEDEVDL